MSEFNLTLICAAEMAEAIMDTLLVHEDIQIFTSMSVHSHGLPSDTLDLAEQVLGRSHQVLIQILLDGDVADSLMRAIRAGELGRPVHFWLTPVTATGGIV